MYEDCSPCFSGGSATQSSDKVISIEGMILEKVSSGDLTTKDSQRRDTAKFRAESPIKESLDE